LHKKLGATGSGLDFFVVHNHEQVFTGSLQDGRVNQQSRGYSI
jgi:hypothetical protein